MPRLGADPCAEPDAGLRAAVTCLVADCQTDAGPEIEFYDDLTMGELGPELQPALLSIVRELLLNACRHSHSRSVLLGLAQDDGYLCVQVQDWGVGFDPADVSPNKRGLKGIRDLVGWLGGTMEIGSQCGSGTCVVVEIPLSQERNVPGRIDQHEAR